MKNGHEIGRKGTSAKEIVRYSWVENGRVVARGTDHKGDYNPKLKTLDFILEQWQNSRFE